MVIDTAVIKKLLSDSPLLTAGGAFGFGTMFGAAATNVTSCVRFLYSQAIKIPGVKAFVIKHAAEIDAALNELEKDVKETSVESVTDSALSPTSSSGVIPPAQEKPPA